MFNGSLRESTGGRAGIPCTIPPLKEIRKNQQGWLIHERISLYQYILKKGVVYTDA